MTKEKTVEGDAAIPRVVIAPLPFDLRLEQYDDRTVVWRTETFPPHWVGTTVRLDVEARDAGSTVKLPPCRFAGDDRQAGSPIPGVRSWRD
jgi:hypothetical protein